MGRVMLVTIEAAVFTQQTIRVRGYLTREEMSTGAQVWMIVEIKPRTSAVRDRSEADLKRSWGDAARFLSDTAWAAAGTVAHPRRRGVTTVEIRYGPSQFEAIFLVGFEAEAFAFRQTKSPIWKFFCHTREAWYL
ncbi:hypothetical protein ACLOJK_027343, partial [Asimina triloba]